ncbi:acetyl-CoA acetyltransferase, cytosolic [Halyomorpha halys]|uniref:acetyl-CoA acetyltransferase, cytosolic n=1 Tax=Halyomorpha halys TaxID=286706 RepID=UPI0006D4E1DA|nr:acetyl-CoA acetyltransferase, cytosolic [Halyomorpha halys]
MSDPTVVIVEAVRTPIGCISGSLSSVKSHELGTAVIKELLLRTKVPPSEISEVIIGQVLTAGVGQNPAKQSAMNAGLPITVPAYTINLLCGSGLKSVWLGYQSIKTDDANIVICGGQESMSLAPHCVLMRKPLKMGNTPLVCTLTTDGLTDAFHSIHMGVTAENVAQDFKLTREEQDLFAVKSQNKTEIAQKQGYFDKEIVSITVKDRKGDIIVSKDEFPAHGTTYEGLQRLRPAFAKDGTVTAGNASGMNDGAAGVILMSLDEARKKNLTPKVKIVGFAQGGLEPRVMGLGPIPAVKNLLKKISWSIEDVDLFELNEAFSAQSIAVIRELGIDEEKVNINGGAISLGHPLGASGTRVLVTLIHALERTGKSKGIAALCIGGGMGIAIAVERI